MRPGVVVLIVLSIVFGATFGALNSERIAFDLYFIAQAVETPYAQQCSAQMMVLYQF